MHVIAVDIGSTYIKAALCDIESRILRQELKFPTPGRLDDPDGKVYENHAGDFVTIAETIIHTFTSQYEDIKGVLFSTQMHGCVLSHPDQEDDRYISWQDARSLNLNPATGKSYLEELEELLPAKRMEGTGVCVKPALALSNLYTLFEMGVLEKKPGASVDTLGSYLIFKLTGRRVCHITNAAPMGFADILNNSWRQDILETAGLDFLELPQITRDLSCCGYYERDGLRLELYPDIGDVQASVYGSGAEAGDLIVNIATAGQLILVQDRYVPGDYEVRPYFDGKYCNVISRMPAGRNLDVQIEYMAEIGEKIFGKTLSRGEIWEKIKSFCQKEDSDGLQVDVSFYELPDRLADGGIFHINRSNFTIQNVINATWDDFGRVYRHYAKQLMKGARFDGRLIFAGGAVLKNPELQERIADSLDIRTAVQAPDDEVYEGLLKLAGRCVAESERAEGEK